jgi:hypothetical protein
LDEVGAALADATPLTFLQGADCPGEIRLAAFPSALVFQAALADTRALPEQPIEGMWDGPYLGVLVAPTDARDTAAVRQPIFFAHGPTASGTLWFFDGARQVDAPMDIAWRVQPRSGGWDIRGVIPWAALGLADGTAAFRLEVMANLVLPGATAPALVTLFGSTPARLELETLAEVQAP